MKVDVDSDSCEGTGYCVRMCPDVFALEEGRRVATVINPDPEKGLWARVVEAERLCPTRAIVVDG